MVSRGLTVIAQYKVKRLVNILQSTLAVELDPSRKN